jgi:hypothetical protein
MGREKARSPAKARNAAGLPVAVRINWDGWRCSPTIQRTGLGGIRASGSRPIHQRRCGVLVPWRCPALTQPWPWIRPSRRRLSDSPRAFERISGLRRGSEPSQASHALPRTAVMAWNDSVCWDCAVTPSVSVAEGVIPWSRRIYHPPSSLDTTRQPESCIFLPTAIPTKAGRRGRETDTILRQIEPAARWASAGRAQARSHRMRRAA